MSDDSLPLENAHEHKNVFPFAMAEIASWRAVAGLARRRASAAWLTGHGRVQNVKFQDDLLVEMETFGVLYIVGGRVVCAS